MADVGWRQKTVQVSIVGQSWQTVMEFSLGLNLRVGVSGCIRPGPGPVCEGQVQDKEGPDPQVHQVHFL